MSATDERRLRKALQAVESLVSECLETLLNAFVVVDVGNVDALGSLFDFLEPVVQPFAESFDGFRMLVCNVVRFSGIVGEVVEVLFIGLAVVDILPSVGTEAEP